MENKCEIRLGCHQDAHCVAQSATSAICECNPGFYGNGLECISEKTVETDRECKDQEDCLINAHCVQNNDKFICECLPGNIGDGKQSCTLEGF